MKTIFVPGFLLLAASVFASGNSYKIEIPQDSTIEGKALKAGEYKLTLSEGSAVLKMGKQTVEVPAHEVDGVNKVSTNELTFDNGNNLKEVQLGGTNKKILFEGVKSAESGM